MREEEREGRGDRAWCYGLGARGLNAATGAKYTAFPFFFNTHRPSIVYIYQWERRRYWALQP